MIVARCVGNDGLFENAPSVQEDKPQSSIPACELGGRSRE